jgi:hypothetical protein
MVGTAMPGSPVHEQQKMGIIVRCTEDLENKLDALTKVIDDSNKTNAQLGDKVYALNRTLANATWVGAIATTIGTIVAALALCFAAFHLAK